MGAAGLLHFYSNVLRGIRLTIVGRATFIKATYRKLSAPLINHQENNAKKCCVSIPEQQR